MSDKKSELEKLGNWMSNWGSSLYKSTTGKTLPQQPQRESLAPGIYTTLTGKQYPSDPNPVYSQRKPQQSKASSSVTNVGGKQYNLSDPKQKAAYDKVIAADRASRPGQKFADLRGGGGLKDDGSRYSTPDRVTPAPDGGDAIGTQLSPRQMTMDEANSLLTGGYKVANPFSSTQLPATSGNPYFGNSSTPEYRSDAPADTYDVQLSRNLTDGSPFNTDGYTYEVPTNTNIEYLQENGSPKIALPGASKTTDQVDPGNKTAESTDTNRSARIPKRPKGERAAAMWDRQYGRMNQGGSEKNSGTNWGARTAADNSDPNIARRRGFLDAEGSMQGLRRAEATQGLYYAGGQHHMVSPNQGKEGHSDFVAITDKDDVRGYKSGRLTANDLKGKYVKDIKEGTKSETASPKNVGNNYQVTEAQTPTSSIDATAQVDTGVITKAPTLMEEVDVRYTDKDKSGRYNVF